MYSHCIFISQEKYIEIKWKKNDKPDCFSKLSVAAIMEPWQIIKLTAILSLNYTPMPVTVYQNNTGFLFTLYKPKCVKTELPIKKFGKTMNNIILKNY